MIVLLLLKSDLKQYGSLVNNVENPYTRGQNGYPQTLSAIYGMTVNYCNPQVGLCLQVQDGGIAFAQEEEDDTPT